MAVTVLQATRSPTTLDVEGKRAILGGQDRAGAQAVL